MKLFRNKKGQVAPFLILVAAVLILAIPATMLIGEIAFSRIRMANVADSAIVSPASALCRSLNTIKQISFGPGGLLVNYVGLQTFLLSKRSHCPCGGTYPGWFPKGAPLATGFYINSMLTSDRLFKQARKIAEEAPKDLRISLWDRALGGALVDEPKPLIDIPYVDPSYTRGINPEVDCNINPNDPWCDEVEREPKDEPDGKVAYINFDKYLNRDPQLVKKLRAYKKEHPLGDTAWWKENVYSYSYNKTKDRVIPEGTPLGETTGVLEQGDPIETDPYDGKPYEAYFRAELEDVPNNISVEPQRMIMIYYYLQPIYHLGSCTGCAVKPAFIPHPYAWIRKIDIDSTRFNVGLKKSVSFLRIPFFGQRPVASPPEECEPGEPCERRPTFQHTSKIRIQGSVWSGYEPKLEQ